MPKLEIVQVEVSTRCQLSCLMCPKSCFRNEWIAKDMDLETFRLIPFRKFRYAHLQGWGEPLLNPNIREMIEIAAQSCMAGLTTNGLLIDKHLESLLNLDLVAVSVASGEKNLHERERGCSFEKLAENIRLLSESRKGRRPKLVIATMMLKSTIKSLPKIIDFAAECGADEVIANNLDYIPSESLADERVFGSTPNPEVEASVEEAARKAESTGVSFVVRPRVMEEALACAENPLKNCFITVDGRVAPCTYLHLPTTSKAILRYFEGKVVEVPKIYFGHVSNFELTWKSKDYRSFRGVFEKRLSQLYNLIPFNFFTPPQLPLQCRSCYKAYSL